MIRSIWLVVLMLAITVGAVGQSRTSERIINVAFSQLSPTAPEGSVRVVINGSPTTPCTVGSNKVLAVKLDNVWRCTDLAGLSGFAPTAATYITQTPHATLTSEQALSVLSTGLVKSTTGTGVLTIAVPGVDFLAVAGNGSQLTNLDAGALASGVVATVRGGFGANVSAAEGVPLFTAGVPAFTGTTGTGTFVRSGATLAVFAPTTSAQLSTLLTDETGSGPAVFGTSPTLTTPTIGSFANANHDHSGGAGGGQLNASNVFSAGIVPPANIITGGVINLRCLRVDGTGNIVAHSADCGSGEGGGGDALVSNPLSQFAATTSAQLAGIITNETGGNLLVFSDSPHITTPTGIVKGDVGLGNVDNTSDAGKPISTATQAALDLKANIASPTFTGVPAAPTAAVDTNTTQLATTAYVVGQGYAKLASPTFTGTPTLPTGTIAVTQSAGNSTTAVATTAFVTTADNLKAPLANPTFTGTVSIPTPFTLGGVSVLPTGTELNFVDGVTSSIQTQLNGRALTGSVVSSGLTMATARLLGRSTASTGAIEEITVGSGLSLSGGTLSTTGGGSGTVTVVGGGSLTSTALVTGGGTTTLQTPSATATLDSSGNISTPGSITSGAGSSAAGTFDLGEGTAPALIPDTFSIYAPAAVAAGGLAYVVPGTAASGVMRAANSSGVMTITHDAGISHLAASTSADLAAVLSDETGTGPFVLRDAPTIAFANAGLTVLDTDGNQFLTIAPGSNLTSNRILTVTTGDAARTIDVSGGNLTLGGALTTSGSSALTLTTTGATNVTLPTAGTLSVTVASGTSALGTSAIASGACATVVTTAATGTATTDVIGWGFNGDPTAVTGYAPSANGMLTIIAYPSANNVNFKVCNNLASSVTPGAITLNWRVVR